MKLIPLTQGKFAQVDDDLYEILMSYKWRTDKNRRTFYARTDIRDKETGKRTSPRMHTIVLDLLGLHVPGLVVDHIDGNGINNQSANLRMVTVKENNANRHDRG